MLKDELEIRPHNPLGKTLKTKLNPSPIGPERISEELYSDYSRSARGMKQLNLNKIINLLPYNPRKIISNKNCQRSDENSINKK